MTELACVSSSRLQQAAWCQAVHSEEAELNQSVHSAHTGIGYSHSTVVSPEDGRTSEDNEVSYL